MEWRTGKASNDHGRQYRYRPQEGSQHRPTPRPVRNNTSSAIEVYRERILKQIHSHRVTFLQGETGCGKSVNVPQFILDDATARGRPNSVKIVVAQPRRIAAVSLAQFVAHSRGEPVGWNVGFAVARDRAGSIGMNRLTFVTSGYLLEWLAHDATIGRIDITHIILDEVHVRSVEQDLLLLILKLFMAGVGNSQDVRSSLPLQATKLVIMSATMEVRPLQEYFSCLLRCAQEQIVEPIIILGRAFPLDVVHVDEIIRYLPSLPKTVADLATRLVEISGAGERALDGTNLPRFAVDLVTGLVSHIGRAGDCILVFVANVADIFDLQQGFERAMRDNTGMHNNLQLDVHFLHSMLSKEEQQIAIAPAMAMTLKVVIATNIAESSLTIPNVRVVIDLGHCLQFQYDIAQSCTTVSRVWCSKASARQRAGRAGRLFPGVVLRLYTLETFKNLPEYEKPAIALENLASTILRVKSLFQYRFPKLLVLELLQQLLDSPQPRDVDKAMQALRAIGAVTTADTSDSCELTLLGRLAIRLLPDVDLARLVFLGIMMGCGVDCVVIAAGMSLQEDIFYQPLLINRKSMDPVILQERRLANAKARMDFDGGYSSDLLAYRQVYLGWLNATLHGMSSQWVARSELHKSRLQLFLLKVRLYAQKTVDFIRAELGHYFCMHWELDKFASLAAVDSGCFRNGRHESVRAFSNNIAVVQLAIAGAFSRNWLLGLPATARLGAVAEIREFENSNMPAHLSFKLRDVPPDLAGVDILKLEKALKVLAPFTRVVPLGARAVLVQCEIQQAKTLTSQPVIMHLPHLARIASYMAKNFSRQGSLIVYAKDSANAEVEELYLGRPSGLRTIKWTTRMGNELRKVQFNRLCLLPRAVEVRKDIPFHIGVAATLVLNPDTKGLTASHVTVLPQDNLLSVLALLIFRPSGPEGEFHVRLLSGSDRNRIYSIRYQGTELELAPRFIYMEALKKVDTLRSKFERVMAGTDNRECNLGQDMMDLHHGILTTRYGAPLLAPDIGPWLAYPSLMPVKEKVDHELTLLPHQSDSWSPGTSQNIQSSPLLVQSRNDLHADGHDKFLRRHLSMESLKGVRTDYQDKFHRGRHGESSHVDGLKLLHVQLFEQAFEAANLQVDWRELAKWIHGNKSYNGLYFELLQKLVKQPGDVGVKKTVLQYVYLNRKELVNKKQMKELEGLYHSICNPDLVIGMPHGGFGTKVAQKIEISPRNFQQKCEVVTPHGKNDVFIRRQVPVQQHQRDMIISVLKYQQLAAEISVGHFSGNYRPGLVTVSGMGMDVEIALQWINSIIHAEYFTAWRIDDTYIDSRNMELHVRCLAFDGWEYQTNNVVQNTPVEGRAGFVLVQDNHGKVVHGRSHACSASSLYHGKMKEVFDKGLEWLGRSDNVELQARLGRVIFQCQSFIRRCLPFSDHQAEPLGKLRKYLDRHQMRKQRFNDSIPEKEFYHLRACLHLCHPNRVHRKKTCVIVVSNPSVDDITQMEKLEIVDAPEAPERFHLQSVSKKTRLAVVDIVRLNSGAIEADVRLSMQTKDDQLVSQEARDYVGKILRRSSKLEFPPDPYIVHLQRHKEAEVFEFDDLWVSLTEVKQIRAGLSRWKYEVEFTARVSRSEDGKVEVPISALTSRIPLILEQVQSVCSQMSWIGPSCTSIGLGNALLWSWTVEHSEARIKDILIHEFCPPQSKGEVVGEGREEISSQICNLVEMLCHCDGRILKMGVDIGTELQLVLLRIMRAKKIALSQSVEVRVKWFLANHKLEPENALHYACLVKCHCSTLDWTWDSVLQPYVMQLILEQRLDILEEFSSHLNLSTDFLDCSSGQLRNAIMRSSIWTILCALTHLILSESTGLFLKLFNVLVTQKVEVVPPPNLVRRFVADLLGYHDSKAAPFVGGCLEWTVDNEPSILDWTVHMPNLFWLFETLKMLDIAVNDDCRSKILDLLLRLPSSMQRKKDLEEVLLEVYDVDEVEFRNLHYQNILQQLGPLQDTHKKELQRRGLTDKQCNNFNFRSWIRGKIHGRDFKSSSLIPGLNEKGTHLVGSRGIFIPARDPTGQITGGQIKVDENITGKYVWLSSNKVFNGGKGPQIGGELPLFCCVSEEGDTSIVGLCEGGLKAHVLAAYSGLSVIGASGADFSQSKNLLESYLAMMDAEQVLFFPDAGSQCNDQVIRCYFRTFRLLRDWGCTCRVGWWGQVNKAEYDDIDDYLVKNGCATEIELFSTYEFWQLVHPDVQAKLGSEFPEYTKPQVFSDVTGTGEETFTDEDDIKVVKMLKMSDIAQKTGFGDSYQIIIPKERMRKMPRAPDDYVTPSSVPNFTIEVVMVQMEDLGGVEAAIGWLFPEYHTNKLLGLDCEHGLKGDLNLIQLSTHQRCVLIRLTNESLAPPSKLATILEEKTVVKSGAEVHNDALAIYNTVGLMVNGCKNISPLHKTMRGGTKGMLEIFRDLYGWEWVKKKDVTRSDWGCETLTLEQVKYAALDAWASRMIAIEGPAALDKTVTSLGDLPEGLLKLFARALANSNSLQRSETNVFETSGNIIQSGQRSTLRLLQSSFRQRVTGTCSLVELRFNDGRTSAHFQAKSKVGKSVTLTPLRKQSKKRNSTSATDHPSLPINIGAISSIVVDNSKNYNRQSQRLGNAFYHLLCHPEECPRHLSLSLKCERKEIIANNGQQYEKPPPTLEKPERWKPSTPKKPERTPKKPERAALPREASELNAKPFKTISASLNDSQRDALHQILTSPLSATIGPPGTGKTRLITAVARAWLLARGEQEILLCTAYQNVAARNLAEALSDEQVSGVLLLVSEDYFVEWHESFYEKLAKSVVITKSRCEIPGALEDWRARNKRSAVSILVCTLALVGSRPFMTSLMGGKVTAMVIDECSQASEGSCIHPLTCLPDLSVLTVLGDPHQLPPYSGSGGVKVPSIFDLVANGCEVKLLREQYRMPPNVCDFISSEVYQNELQTAPSRRQENDWQQPLLWVDVDGVATKDPGNPSPYNTAEAKAIVGFCQNLTKWSDNKKGAGMGVVVLTLYEEQKKQISKLLAGEKLQEGVNVHNVDSFQGQQSDIVLISLVAGRNFSQFAADRHRSCVMLSRVKRFLCVFGNYHAVRRNSQAQMWKSLAEFCGARGLVVGPKDTASVLSANMQTAKSTRRLNPTTPKQCPEKLFTQLAIQ